VLDLIGIAPGPSDASINRDKYIYRRGKRFSAVKRIQKKLQKVPEKELNKTISEAIKIARLKANWKEYIISTPDVLQGKPRIKGTRIPASVILGYLATGYTSEKIIKEFPDLTKEQIDACLDYDNSSNKKQAI
jgi:uncharacterized protein (DUF433 family)